MAYIACSTQWQYAGMGARCGLRYEGCTALLREYLPTWQQDPAFADVDMAELMRGLQIIEGATLGADAELRAKNRARDPSGPTEEQRIGSGS
ncbi:hypothetical protein [Microcystis phage MACPNOA1]|nr:hypothetical protein [Microcystis phage MACPNOA1]